MRLAVLGGGAFGTALAAELTRAGREVTLVRRRASRALPPELRATTDPAPLASAEAILIAVPAQHQRAALSALPRGPGALILTAKGVERDSLKLGVEIAVDVAPGRACAVLSGPCFADDLLAGKPAAMTLAAADQALGTRLQQALSSDRLRLYLNDDPVGAQIGGAVKNVIAIACGAAEGLGLGESARAALIARGFAELRRLTLAMGGRAETAAGLSGLGDLALTCGSARSRNFAYGRALVDGAAAATTVEGRDGAEAAAALARRAGVETPIIDMVADLAAGRAQVETAVARLMARPLRPELE